MFTNFLSPCPLRQSISTVDQFVFGMRAHRRSISTDLFLGMNLHRRSISTDFLLKSTVDATSTVYSSRLILIDRRYRPYSQVGEFLSTVDIDCDRSTGRLKSNRPIDDTCANIHTNTHRHTRTHTLSHAHRHTLSHKYTHTHTQTRTHTHSHAHIHTHTLTRTHTLVHKPTPTPTPTHACTHTHTYIHRHTHTQTHARARTHTHKHMHIHTYKFCMCIRLHETTYQHINRYSEFVLLEFWLCIVVFKTFKLNVYQ